MLDIGVYALSLIRWFFAETANQVLSQVKYAPTGVSNGCFHSSWVFKDLDVTLIECDGCALWLLCVK